MEPAGKPGDVRAHLPDDQTRALLTAFEIQIAPLEGAVAAMASVLNLKSA